MRQITFQVLAVDGTVLLFDGFIRADSLLDVGDKAPFSIKLKDYLSCNRKLLVWDTSSKFCLYQVKEFSIATYVTAIEGHGFLIVWRWVEQ